MLLPPQLRRVRRTAPSSASRRPPAWPGPLMETPAGRRPQQNARALFLDGCGEPGNAENLEVTILSMTRVYTYVIDMSFKSVITTTNATTACKSKNAPCKATDTCCENGRCQINGADVTGTTEGTCRVSEPFPPLSEYQPGYLP